MARHSKNKYIVMIYLLILLFLLIKGASINQPFSQSIKRAEGDRQSNFTLEAEALGEITADKMLWQEITLPSGVLQVGIRFGTYRRVNDSNYEILLYDNEGNVVAKKVISAKQIEDNQMCYIDLYGRTSEKITYVLEIRSKDAENGNAITGYGIKTQDGHSSCMMGGQDTGKEIVIELIMQKVFPLTLYFIILLSFGLVVALFHKKIGYVIKKAASLLASLWKKQKRKIIFLNIALSVFGIVIVFFVRTEEYHILNSFMDSNHIIRPCDGTMTQSFQSTQDFEAIEIRLATYLKNYQHGKLHFALYEGNSKKLLVEQEIPGDQIRDNKLLRWNFEKISVEKLTDFYFELWTEDFEDQILGVYCRGDNENIQYQLLRTEMVQSSDKFVPFLLWGIFWIVLYLCIDTPLKKYKRIIATSVISLFVGLLFSTYANYNSISLEALAKNLGLSVNGRELQFDQIEIQNCTRRIYRYDAKGNLFSVYDHITIEELQTKINMVEIYLKNTDYQKKNLLSVYIDNGSGFSGHAEFEYEYVFKGQEKIVLPIKNVDNVERIIISYSMINENGISEESFNNGYQYYCIEKIVFNSQRVLWYQSWEAVLAGIVLVWLISIWQKYRMESVVKGWLNVAKNREGKVFFITIMIYGFVFSVLLPTFQLPDEPVHIKWAFHSIGADELYEEVAAIAEKGVSGVIQNGTKTVNRDAYQEMFHEKLISYRFSLKPNLMVLNYPGQACGILLGIMLRLPVGWILFLAEFSALFLYAVLGMVTIRIVPIKKELFAMILLMPMAVQQAGSFSYDSFNNAIAMLSIAYFLYLALDKEKVGIGELLPAAGMLLILFLIKKVYVVCGSLIFLIPLEKYRICIFCWRIEFKSKKEKLRLLSVIGAVGCLCAAAGLFILIKGGNITAMLEAIRYPKELGRLIIDTVFVQRIAWLKQGSALFGWLDGIIYNWIIFVLFAGLLAAAAARGENYNRWNKGRYILCIGIFMICMVGIILSMVGWSSRVFGTTGNMLNQILLFPAIEGVQGRYFLPVLVLIFLFPITKWIKNIRKYIPAYLVLILVIFTTIFYSVCILLDRYWMI